MKALKALLFCVLVACAQDGADGEDGDDGESVEVEQLASGSSACPAGGVRVSVGRTSEVICNGERGAMGAMGAAGAMGAPGQAGSGGAQGGGVLLKTAIACGALLDLSGVPASLQYEMVTFVDGTVFVSCSAQTMPQIGASNTEIYAGWQQGAATGGCSVASDASGAASGGWWEFTLVAGLPRVVYHDTGAADDLASFSFPSADCVTTTQPN